jgi:signal transduction histidine kinase/CheY-like chemotaxis protein
VVVLTIDVGGLAQTYRDTLWVNHDGSYLRPGQPAGGRPEAFETFPGLAAIFDEGKLALWKGGQGRQMLWLPMFLTEDGFPLWVGRVVDPSPLDAFRNELIVRVLTIIAVLVLVVMVLARWIAARVEHFGHELLGGIRRILSDGQPLRFSWAGPRELRELGERLTELAETQAEHLRLARAHTRELEQSNRYKSQFLANVSHELRTPLNSILLLSKMLGAEGNSLSPAQRRQAQVIHEAGRDLRALIDNILDISRIESGRLSLSLDSMELRPMLEDLIELFSPQLTDKPVELSLRLEPGAPESLQTDREKLRQILKNFLANAIKFTERGEVRVEVGTHPDSSRPLVLSVIDTGIGIPRDKQEIIFEAFQQADGSTRRRYGGTGLGLAISRELATLLGGAIEVESSPGVGSRFSLLLPLSPEGAEPETAPAPITATALDILADETSGVEVVSESVTEPGAPWVLIIERDVKTLVRLTSELSRHGLRAQTAADLDEALETLREEGEGCALVLLAAQMSTEMTCDTIRILLAETQQAPPALAILGSADPDPGLNDCLGVGAVALLAKPVDPEALTALLAQVRGRSAPETPGRTGEASGQTSASRHATERT